LTLQRSPNVRSASKALRRFCKAHRDRTSTLTDAWSALHVCVLELQPPPREGVFSGYCFHGSDYVFGQTGASHFELNTGRAIRPGLDGWYLTIRPGPNGTVVGCDAIGFQRIYYFRSSCSGCWAISNSVEVLAEHLRHHGVLLEADPAALANSLVKAEFATCATTFETCFRGVRLLPSWLQLRIASGGLSVEPVEELPKMGYADSLRSFIELWISRFETLLSNDELSVACQLTGGKDSRAVFSLLTAAARRLQQPLPKGISAVCGRFNYALRDYEVAEQLAQKWGVPFNSFPPSSSILNDTASYLNWRRFSLAAYKPIHFPPSIPEAKRIHFSGVGGENFRPFYKALSVEQFLEKSACEPRWLWSLWTNSVRATFGTLSDHAPGFDPLLLHYRKFRTRIHGGRTPGTEVCFQPLASQILNQAKLSPQQVADGQLLVDVIASCDYDLLLEPYDDPAKMPSAPVLDRVSRIKPSAEPAPGRCYYGTADDWPAVTGSQGASPRARLNLLLEDFEAVSRDSRVRSFVGDELIGAGQSVLKRAAESEAGQLAHAWDGLPVSSVMTAGLAFGILPAVSAQAKDSTPSSPSTSTR